MLSFDANVAVHAANRDAPAHVAARDYIESLAARRDIAICELMLVELYLKLRNERIFPRPLSAAEAATVYAAYRSNRVWQLIDCAPVMPEVWERSARRGFAFSRVIDVRLACTLRHHGVTEFATANTRDFQGLGFDRVWNPLAD